MYKGLSAVMITLAVLQASVVASWTYANEGQWSATYADCTKTAQSPINIVRTQLTQSLSSAVEIKGNYNTLSSKVKLKNAGGMTQKVVPNTGDNFGTTTYNGKEYTCVQFHSHQPSEHTFDGMRYDMELHFVHTQGTATNDFLVLTVFFNISGEDNELLTNIKYSTGSSTVDGTVDIEKDVNIWNFLKSAQVNKEYITYKGSFTTPPCSEGVNFVLFRDYLTMSKAQWDGYAASLPSDNISYTAGTGNYRGVNALNGRTVTLTSGYVTGADLLKAAVFAATAIWMMLF